MHKFDNASKEPKGQIPSWKSALPATLRRTSKVVGAVGLAGVIMATSACSGTSEANTPAPSASSTVAAEPKSSIAGTVVNGIPTKPELAYDGKNYYVQTTIADDDPAMIYDEMKVRTNVFSLFSVDEIKEGQKLATKFVAEEVLDSTLNDNHADKETIDKWLAANKEKIDPAQYDLFAKHVHAPYNPDDSFLVMGVHREGKYELVSGPEQTRILSRTITPTVTRGDTIDGKKYIEYEVKARVAYKVKLNGQDTIETVDAVIQTILSKDTVTNKWHISGSTNKFTPTPAK